MIEDMRNVVAPVIFPKAEPTVEYVKYNRKKELLNDILVVLILLGIAIIFGIITWFLIH